MWEWDNKAMMEAISLHDRVMRMHLTKFDGYEVATEGDAFLIAFHTPGNGGGRRPGPPHATGGGGGRRRGGRAPPPPPRPGGGRAPRAPAQKLRH